LYRRAGTYTVTLVARDSLGETAVARRAVSVSPMVSIAEGVTVGDDVTVLPPVDMTVGETVTTTDGGTETALAPANLGVTEHITGTDTGH
jgi:UDP-3-O-[3-hydroxymyristoyl] glucosamine N-acyltransferase